MAKLGLGNISRETPLKTVPAEKAALLVMRQARGSFSWKRYHDWSLGNHGGLISLNHLILSGMDSPVEIITKIEGILRP